VKRCYWISRSSMAVLALAGIASVLAACMTNVPTGGTILSIVKSDKPRLSPSLDEAPVPDLVEENTAFALDLYRVLLSETGQENSLVSPYSLSVALAMTYAGARGETARQMAEALHYTLPQEQLHLAFNALDRALASRGEGAEQEAFRLKLVNTIWPQQGYAFLDAFLDTLAENYGAGLHPVDFARSEEARQAINEWVSKETERKIEELLPPGSITGETALVLSNAVYYYAAWMHPFAEEATADGAFTLLDGQQVTVPTMHQVAQLGYAEHPGVRAVELPYANGKLSMVVLLPDESTFKAFAQGLETAELRAILGELEPTQVRLALPKFGFDAGCEAKRALMRLGMVDAFGDKADFSGMDGTTELFIDEVYHKAFIAVDEAGTEAAAASAVVMARKGTMAEQEVEVSRPFLFLIRDVETGTILFLGHVVNPA
jgi:serpin B